MNISINNDIKAYGRYYVAIDKIEININECGSFEKTIKELRHELMHRYMEVNKCKTKEHIVMVLSEYYDDIDRIAREFAEKWWNSE